MSPLETQKNVLPFLRECSLLAPTFLSLDNHEWMLDSTDLITLASTCVVVLDNTYQSITFDEKEIILGGLTSGYVTDYRRFKEKAHSSDRYPRQESISRIGGAVHARDHKPETAWLSTFTAVKGFHILLSHHPEYWPLIPSSIELVLSGHAHGGQWRVFGRGEFAPSQGWWPKDTKGVYDARLVMSAGLSNTTWIPRIGNPAEIVYLEP